MKGLPQVFGHSSFITSPLFQPMIVYLQEYPQITFSGAVIWYVAIHVDIEFSFMNVQQFRISANSFHLGYFEGDVHYQQN